MKALLIAEKPPLMKELKDVYKKFGHKDQITFKSFVGHTMTLIQPHEYKPEWEKWNLAVLPMIPATFRYKPTKDKMAIYKEIKDEILNGGYDYVINACDPGREGQHIFFSFYHAIGAKLPVKRIWFSDLTENELSRALNNLRDESEPALKNMTTASKYRAYFDWLIGLNGTRAVSMIASKKINVGRVMTPVLKLIVEREIELRNFVPKDFWEIEANFGDRYRGIYFDHNNENETRFFDKAKAEIMCGKFSEQGTVLSVEKKKETKYAPSLHSLQELSNEANRTYGYTMSETLEIAQTLYEKKILSYPRTNSQFITKAIAKDFKKHLKPLLSIQKLREVTINVISDPANIEAVAKNKKYVDDRKVTDHYAIIPTGLSVDLSKLSTKEQNVFMLVAKRFLAIFLPPMTTNKTSIITESNGHHFKTNGSVLLDLGFMKLYKFKRADNVLPDIKKGEVFDIQDTQLIQKKTSPPQRYNDDLLGKAMENPGKFIEDEELSRVFKDEKGLGTPATRGEIVKKIIKLEMVELKGSGKVKSYFATDFGIEIIQGLQGKDITMPELTATWEQKLSRIEEGTYDPKDFYKEMIEYTQAMIDDFKHTEISVSKNSDQKEVKGKLKVIGKCPKCSKNVVVTNDYYLCEDYKNSCDFIQKKVISGTKISEVDMKAILSGKQTKEKEFTWKSGKKGKAKLEWKDNKINFVF
ncbi:DNA topoisomerase (plasmid) [Brevibacillus halotolerans]|nr:DNA topoisomerase [Brevibacillus halotolerans]